MRCEHRDEHEEAWLSMSKVEVKLQQKPQCNANASKMISLVVFAVLCICSVEGFLHHGNTNHYTVAATSSTSQLKAFQWPTLPSFDQLQSSASARTVGERNGLDEEYPWRFEGRFIFRPSLVRITPSSSSPPSASLLSLFGYSLGGSVVLEYDVSPVGPYREYVTMGGVVGLGQVSVGETNKRLLGVGQWGTDLYVSTQVAEDVCKQVWGVPAQVANIDFEEEGNVIQDGPDSEVVSRSGVTKKNFKLSGWDNTRVLSTEELQQQTKRFGNIPIFWTPTIKALWAPISLPNFSSKVTQEELLPVHKLRLSASALRLKQCKRIGQSEGEIPIGLTLVVDNVLIEIGEQVNFGSL